MRNPIVLALVSLSSVMCGCASNPHARETIASPELRAEIEAANRELERRYNTGDLLGVAAMYTDDAVMLGPGRPGEFGIQRTAGRDAIDAYWTGPAERISWDLEVFEVWGARNVAHQLGRSTLTTRRDGEIRASVVDFAVFWRKGPDGQWRIEADCYWPVPPN